VVQFFGPISEKANEIQKWLLMRGLGTTYLSAHKHEAYAGNLLAVFLQENAPVIL